MEKEHSFTPGPWRWELSMDSKRVHLVGGVPTFDLTVLDFTRWGMSGASMRLRDGTPNMNIMFRCDKWAQKVEGREHHASWFQTLSHPDAQLIAASPDLLAALTEIVNAVDAFGSLNNPEWKGWAQARAAIAKAKGTI